MSFQNWSGPRDVIPKLATLFQNWSGPKDVIPKQDRAKRYSSQIHQGQKMSFQNFVGYSKTDQDQYMLFHNCLGPRNVILKSRSVIPKLVMLFSNWSGPKDVITKLVRAKRCHSNFYQDQMMLFQNRSCYPETDQNQTVLSQKLVPFILLLFVVGWWCWQVWKCPVKSTAKSLLWKTLGFVRQLAHWLFFGKPLGCMMGFPFMSREGRSRQKARK